MTNKKGSNMIGIIAAMNVEMESLRSHMENTKTDVISGIKFVRGTLEGQEVVSAVCGIGKVFAAICAQTMILRYSPALLINSGVAGSLSKELGIGDVAVASLLVQHDMDTSPLGDPVGLVSGINQVYFKADQDAALSLAACVQAEGAKSRLGCIASGDQFICDREKKNWIRDTFSAVACEMEGAAIAHVATVNETPFAVLRAISDEADGEASMDYPTFVRMAAARSVNVLRRFLREM
jgi:adenosylhomocysteine nucleosidase